MSKIDHPDIEKLCKIIKGHRKAKKLTQEAISELMGIDDGNYRRLEGGRVNPSFLMIKKFCDAIDMSLEEFFANKM